LGIFLIIIIVSSSYFGEMRIEYFSTTGIQECYFIYFVTALLDYSTQGKGILYYHLEYKGGELIIRAEGSDIYRSTGVFYQGNHVTK